MEYSALLLDRPFLVSDKPERYFFLTERHVQAVWYEQKYFKNLKTSDGKETIILSPGIWNAESGPDFWKAHFIINGQEVRGDVEIHLSDEEWYNHQHHLDPKYDQVVFHLSFWKSKHPKELITSKGKKLICAYLEDFLTISPARIPQLIDLELYPYKQSLGTGACSQKLFKKMPIEEMRSFLNLLPIGGYYKNKNILKPAPPTQKCNFR